MVQLGDTTRHTAGQESVVYLMGSSQPGQAPLAVDVFQIPLDSFV